MQNFDSFSEMAHTNKLENETKFWIENGLSVSKSGFTRLSEFGNGAGFDKMPELEPHLTLLKIVAGPGTTKISVL